jgi:hypothetical protein
MDGDNIRIRKQRSKTGCFTCRKRKVRCDEHRPVCNSCIRLRLACSYLPADGEVSSHPRRQYTRPSSQPTCNTTPSASESTGSATPQLRSSVNERIEIDDDRSTSFWWSSLSKGLLDVPWLEHPLPEADHIFDNDGRDPNELPSNASRTQLSHESAARPCRNVTLMPQDRDTLQHFTTTMVRFCLLRNTTDEHLYSYILINFALFHSTLFNAMLAWSSLHLAHVQNRSNDDARERYGRAYTALIEDMGHDVTPTLLLATIWFLMQYQLILAEGVEGFCELIDLAAEVARAELQDRDAEASMNRFGPIGSLMLVWMSARDSQATYLGRGGRLLGCLKSYPYIYELVDGSSISNNADEASHNSFIVREGAVQRSRPNELQKCMKLSFKNVTVAGQIKILGRNQMQRMSSSAWGTVRANLGVLRYEVEQDDTSAAEAALKVAMGDFSAMPVIDPIHFNRLLLLAEYYASLIEYHNHQPYAVQEAQLPSPQECATRIMYMCERVQTEQPNSPQGVWPMHIFIAGITITDPIYQAWAIRALEKAERWGAHIVKTRKLLEAVIRRQNSTGQRANLVQVMEETTGLFIF